MSNRSAASQPRTGSSGTFPRVSRRKLRALRQHVAATLAARRAEAARWPRPVVH
jgi:hypothetical protein